MEIRDFYGYKIVFQHGYTLNEKDLANININVEDGTNIFIFCCPDYATYETLGKDNSNKEIEYIDVSFLGLFLSGVQYDIQEPDNKFVDKVLYNGAPEWIVCIIDIYGNLIFPDIVHHYSDNIYHEFIDFFLNRILSVINNDFMYNSFKNRLDDLLELSRHVPIEINVTYKDMSSVFKSISTSYKSLIEEFKIKVASLEETYKKEVEKVRSNTIMPALNAILDIIKMGYKIEADDENNIVFTGHASKIKNGDKIYSISTDKFKIRVSIENRDGVVYLSDKGSFHPNIDEHGKACYGDDKLSYTVEGIKEALKRLLIINLNSAYSNDALSEACRILDNHEGIEQEEEIWKI